MRLFNISVSVNISEDSAAAQSVSLMSHGVPAPILSSGFCVSSLVLAARVPRIDPDT